MRTPPARKFSRTLPVTFRIGVRFRDAAYRFPAQERIVCGGTAQRSAGVYDEFPQIAIRIAEIHARGGTLRTRDSTRRTDRIHAACSQMLLCLFDRSIPNDTEISATRDRDEGQTESIRCANGLRYELRPETLLLVDVDLLVLTNLDRDLSLPSTPPFLIVQCETQPLIKR